MKKINVTDDKLRKAVSNLLEYVDYDVWKAYFAEPEDGDYDHQQGELDEMIGILYRALNDPA
jgi:hypothetical protein